MKEEHETMHDTFTDPATEGTFSTAALRNAADAYIQEQLKVHRSIIRYYHERHNALTVTCRIPSEVLAAIFSQVVESICTVKPYDHFDEDVTHNASDITWIPKVSHVCSHWREVALSAPNLWATIPIGYPLWATEMIQRSKAVPPTIPFQRALYSNRADTFTAYFYTFLKDILSSHMSRITNLTLQSSYNPRDPDTVLERFTEILALLEQPAPLLERLKVVLAGPLRSNAILEPGKDRLPDGTAAGSPRLTHLYLDGCGMGWDAPGFSNLKSLTIARLPKNSRPSMTQLLQILSQTPLLESLSIDIRQVSHSMLPSQTSTVNLALLDDITISGDLLSCACLFNHLVFSRRAQTIMIQLMATRTGFDDLCISGMNLLGQKVEQGIEGVISRLELANGIRYWKSKHEQMTEDDEGSIARAHITYPSQLMAGRIVFLQSLSLNQLQSLTIMHSHLDQDTLLVFSDLPHLKSLWCASHEHTLLKVLVRGLATKPGTPVLPPSFTRLQSLTIAYWAMDKAQAKRILAKWLTRCFRLRKKAGLCLEMLKLEDCTAVDQKDLNLLRKCIKKVDWDGNGDIDEDSEEECLDCGEEECEYIVGLTSPDFHTYAVFEWIQEPILELDPANASKDDDDEDQDSFEDEGSTVLDPTIIERGVEEMMRQLGEDIATKEAARVEEARCRKRRESMQAVAKRPKYVTYGMLKEMGIEPTPLQTWHKDRTPPRPQRSQEEIARTKAILEICWAGDRYTDAELDALALWRTGLGTIDDQFFSKSSS
ncbi:hypothetical protein DXG01_009794 [Tephrocybe rancida]|nr:hypothetical protein DXG01_009794 [Tephrocybe rancida]